MSWGAYLKGGLGDSSKLAYQYIYGKGENVTIDSGIYTNSVIVKDAQQAMKDYMRELNAKNRDFTNVNTKDAGFRASAQGRALLRSAGRADAQGYLINDGRLLTEQGNMALKFVNNRFALNSFNTKMVSQVKTRWSVDETYEFQSFAAAPQNVTPIPLGASTLTIPDGLSAYMVDLGLAQPFSYHSQWDETWQL